MENYLICPYYGECGIVNNCEKFHTCRVKELFDDYYKLEQMYFRAVKDLMDIKGKQNAKTDS